MSAITKATSVALLVTLDFALAVWAADAPPVADWPRWRGPDGSGMGVGCGQPLVDDLADMRLVWQSEERKIPANCWHNGTQGSYDSPIVANGKVFIGYSLGTGDILDPEVLSARDSQGAGPERARWNAAVVTDDILLAVCAKTGKTVWKRVLDEGINLFQRRKGGPHTAPCWHDASASSGDGTAPRQGRVYAQSTLGRVFCLDESDGRVIWQQDIEATAKQIAVRDAYKKAGRQHPYRGTEPPEFKDCGWPRLFMYPLCVADGVVVADGGVFDAATGKPMPWPKPPASNGDRNPTCPLRWVCDGQEFFIIGNQCLQPRTGKVVWTINEAGGVTPAISGNHLVATMGRNRGFVGCRVDAKGYQVLWKNADYTLKGGAATGIINDGWFFAEVNPTVWPGPATEQAIGIELATGKVVGPAPFEGVAQSLATSPVGMDGRWFFHVGAGYSGMVMMKANGTDFTQVGLRMPTVKSWMPLPGGSKTQEKLDYCLTSTPAVAGGFMYFRGSDCLWCYDLRRPSEEEMARIRQAREKNAGQIVESCRGGKTDPASAVRELVSLDCGKMAEAFLVQDMKKAVAVADAKKFGALAGAASPLGVGVSASLGPIVNEALASARSDLALAAMNATNILAGAEAEKAKPVLWALLRGKNAGAWQPAALMLRSMDASADGSIVKEMSRLSMEDGAAVVTAAVDVLGVVAGATHDSGAKKAAIDTLVRHLDSKDLAIQKAAIERLGALGPAAAAAKKKLDGLVELPDLEKDAAKALDRIDPARVKKAAEPDLDIPPLDP
jgi:outer membrane protein assembly factor BamB